MALDRGVQAILMRRIYNREVLTLTKSAYVIVNENEKLLTSTIPPVVSFLHIFRRFLHIHLSNVTEKLKKKIQENGTAVI